MIPFHEIERLEGLACKVMQAIVRLRKAHVPQGQTAASDEIRAEAEKIKAQAEKILAIVGERPPGAS
jgi:hypothetical protein